jgi:hypothetical protein
MALDLAPVARYMLVCDDLITDARWPGKPLIVGLISLIRWPEQPVERFTLGTMCVYLVLTGGRGAGTARVVCRDDFSGAEIFRFGDQPLSFEGLDPVGLYGVVFRLRDCHFPRPGAYSVEFDFDDRVVEQRLLNVR